MAKKEFSIDEIKDEIVSKLYHRQDKELLIKSLMGKYEIPKKEDLIALVEKIDKEVTAFRLRMGKVN